MEAEATLGRERLPAWTVLVNPQLAPEQRTALAGSWSRSPRWRAGAHLPAPVTSPVIGANAFALPSGIIVLTVSGEAGAGGRRGPAVLAQSGHVRHRHIMRRLLEGSAVALLVAGVTGDVAAATSLAAAAPTLVLQSKFSRDNEREADAYALGLLRRAGIGPQHFGAILARMEAQAPRGPMLPFLSTHPPRRGARAGGR
jgi:predicted Zn-dependent protease